MIESGDAQRMNELFGSFGGAMTIGILCIYEVLVLLFGYFSQPVALPLSLGGAFLALLLTGSSFAMPSVISLLMLMGGEQKLYSVGRIYDYRAPGTRFDYCPQYH